MMKQLPCITEKCICYPVCVGKEKIECKFLIDFYMSMTHEYKHLTNSGARTWGTIHMTLPNVQTIPLDVEGYYPGATVRIKK